MSSLYFAPYITEVLKIDKSSIGILGGVNSAVTLFILIFINPVISRKNMTLNLIFGLLTQSLSLFMFIVIPGKSLILTVLCVALFAVGYGVFKPFSDTLLAEVTEGNERAGIYSFINTVSSVITTVIGFISGYMYTLNPRLLYMLSIFILFISIILLTLYYRMKRERVNVY
jgi:predicted MFS family arabinose efflux permease